MKNLVVPNQWRLYGALSVRLSMLWWWMTRGVTVCRPTSFCAYSVASWKSAHRRWSSIGAILCLLVMLSTCGKQMQPVSITVIPAQPGIYAFVAWLTDTDLVVEYEDAKLSDPGGAYRGQLWQLSLDGQMQRMLIPPESGCDRQGHTTPVRLPDARIAYVVRCFPSSTAEHFLYMNAYNPAKGQSTRLVQNPLPSPLVGSGGYAWNPAMTRGITSDGRGRGLTEQLYWLSPVRTDPLDVGLPQAHSASWSPDGTRIAFLGAREQGRSGVARSDSRFNLYIMNPDGTTIRPVVEGFRDVVCTTWSPDNRWIVVAGAFGRVFTEHGLWLVEVQTGQRHLLVQGRVTAPVWSPDGTRLAALRIAGPDRSQQEVIVLDMRHILNTVPRSAL